MPPRILRPYVRVLEDAEYVRGLRDRVDQHVLTLARPAETIKVHEILELAPAGPRRRSAAELLEELRRRELGAAGDLTLEELVARSTVGQRRATSDGAGRGGGRARRGRGSAGADSDPGPEPRPATER